MKLILKKFISGIGNSVPLVASIKNDIKEGKNVLSLERLIETISVLLIALCIKKFDLSIDLISNIFNLF